MPRSYDSPARTRQRRTTQAAIQAAARRLFVDRGYEATSITAVARQAGVSAQTIYNAFGTKQELLRAAVRSAAIGDDADRMFDAPTLDAVLAEPDQWGRWVLLRRATAAVLERAQPMAAVVRAAAMSDPAIRQLWRELEDERRRDVETVVRLLGDVGPLRVPHEEAVDLVWAIGRSTDLYAALAVDRSWSPEAAFEAVSDTIVRSILPAPPEPPARGRRRRGAP